MHQSIQQLIVDRYAAVHGARITADFPNYCTVRDAAGPCAVLGYRSAADGPLFLEQYLDFPVETVVGEALGTMIERARIVEIGAHASSQPRATIALWARTAAELEGRSDVAVAVLTRKLRTMFKRLGLPIVALAPAERARLAQGAAAWGRYYDAGPMVCAGEIAAARGPLARWQGGAE